MSGGSGPRPRGRIENTSALAYVTRCAPCTSLSRSYQLVRDGLIDGTVGSTPVVRAISASPRQGGRFVELANWLAAGQESIGDIPQAVRLLGLQCAHDLLLAVSLQDMLAGLDEDALRAYRERGLLCALAAHFCARRQALPLTGRPLLEGLLAPLGVLLLTHCEPETMAAVLEKSQHDEPIADAVKAGLGVGHQAVAAELLRYWGAPGSLVQAVTGMHMPDRATPHQLEAATLNLAWHLTEARLQGKAPTAAEQFIPRSVWAIVGLRTADLDALAGSVETHYRSLAEALGWPL